MNPRTTRFFFWMVFWGVLLTEIGPACEAAATPKVCYSARFYADIKQAGLASPGDLIWTEASKPGPDIDAANVDEVFKRRVSMLEDAQRADPSITTMIGITSLKDLDALMGHLPGGVKIIMYSFERQTTPDDEIADPVGSAQRFAERVHAAGKGFFYAPTHVLYDKFEHDGTLDKILR